MNIKTKADLDRIKDASFEKIKVRFEETAADEGGNFPAGIKRDIVVCTGSGCVSSGSLPVVEALEAEIKKAGLADKVNVIKVGCVGYCVAGPLLVIYPDHVFYQRVTEADAEKIVNDHLIQGKLVDSLLWVQPKGKKKHVAILQEIDFFKSQKRLVIEKSGLIDPESIEEYIAVDGYQAVAKILGYMSPKDVREEVKTAGIRGRGGAGFPTGVKWDFASASKSDVKYVICNADEGDPGAFMDRSILEGNPHSAIEGMIICAYAIGANDGFVYVRGEYPLAVKRLGIAIKEARAHGLLGKNILGSGFDFDIDIRIGAGAFVCGEETALMHSIEGKRGEPSPRPPYPAVSGLWGKPSNINNVETLANIPWIIRNGGAAYAAIGTEKSKGTKVFALAGDVVNTGLVEVPMGGTLREIVFEVGGGLAPMRKFKAAQLGGPSGGCIPKEHLDMAIDYDSLTKIGAMMGSGGLIVMDNKSCMVDVAKFFLEFVQEESCGKCPPCRVGTKRMLESLERITSGEGKEGDIEDLVELANDIKLASLCGLGQTAPNPVLSTLRYFRDEYESHIKDKICPAGVCKELLRFEVDEALCKKCGRCLPACDFGAVSWKKGETAQIDKDKCIECRACIDECPFDAIY